MTAEGENPPDHGVGRRVPDQEVPGRIFLVVGAAVVGFGLLYLVLAGEEAGATMFVLAGVLGLWCGAYLWLRVRSPADEPDTVEEPFLPHSSPWPFTIGVGAFLLGNGLLIGGWFSLPGAAILALGVGGFIRETRLRRVT